MALEEFSESLLLISNATDHPVTVHFPSGGQFITNHFMVINSDNSEAHPDHHNYFLSSPSRVELLLVVIVVMVWRFFRSNELPKT